MTDYRIISGYSRGVRGFGPVHHLQANGRTLAIFYGPDGADLLGVLQGAIAAADTNSEHTITNGDTGQMTYGRLGQLLKE